MKKNILSAVSVLAIFGLGISNVEAQSIVEQFDYTVGQSLVGQTGGTGLSGAWTTAAGTKITPTIVSGLSFGSNLQTAGNAVQVNVLHSGGANGWDDATNNVARGVTTLPGANYFSSYLFNISNQGGANNMLGVGSGATGTYSSGILATNYGSDNGAIRNSGGDNGAGGANFATGETYIAIGKYDATATSAWYLTLADFNSWVTIGSSNEANLATYAFNAGSRATSGGNGTNTFLGDLRIGGYFEGGPLTTTIVFDEIRYGSTLASVTPIPEPSTYALLGFGLVALVFLRRRYRTA